jgi:hypothetical protein
MFEEAGCEVGIGVDTGETRFLDVGPDCKLPTALSRCRSKGALSAEACEFSRERNCLAPRVHRRGAKGAMRSAQCDVTLDVKCVVDGGVG